MARGKKQIKGQLSFNFCLDTTNQVVQSNDLISGKQALDLNSAKLIRAAIMQIKPNDKELKPYVLTIKEFANLIGVSTDNVYRDVDKITDDIVKHPVDIRIKTDKGKTAFIKIPWVQQCEYVPDVGIAIELNSKLKKYILQLSGNYTQYALEQVMTMRSVYAIRIFELLQESVKTRLLPKEGVNIEIPVQTLRECCDVENKYQSFSNFRARVLDIATKEINRVTTYRVSYTYKKVGRKVTSIIFHMNMSYHDDVWPTDDVVVEAEAT